jgi:hypothetical protein
MLTPSREAPPFLRSNRLQAARSLSSENCRAELSSAISLFISYNLPEDVLKSKLIRLFSLGGKKMNWTRQTLIPQKRLWNSALVCVFQRPEAIIRKTDRLLPGSAGRNGAFY